MSEMEKNNVHVRDSFKISLLHTYVFETSHENLRDTAVVEDLSGAFHRIVSKKALAHFNQ